MQMLMNAYDVEKREKNVRCAVVWFRILAFLLNQTIVDKQKVNIFVAD